MGFAEAFMPPCRLSSLGADTEALPGWLSTFQTLMAPLELPVQTSPLLVVQMAVT